MVTYLLFPLANLIRLNGNITKSIIQKIRIMLIVSPKESCLMLFSKLLIVPSMISTFHTVRFKFFYAIFKCASLLSYTTLPYVTVKVTNSQGWKFVKVCSIFMQGFKLQLWISLRFLPHRWPTCKNEYLVFAIIDHQR